MGNLSEKIHEIIKDQETFEAATNIKWIELPWNSRDYLHFRQEYLVPVFCIYRDVILDPYEYKKKLSTQSAEVQQSIVNKQSELERMACWNPGLERLKEVLSIVEIQERDYLLDKAWCSFDEKIGKMESTIIQQFRFDTYGARETIDRLLEQPVNVEIANCLLYCYNQMRERIKEVKGWK